MNKWHQALKKAERRHLSRANVLDKVRINLPVNLDEDKEPSSITNEDPYSAQTPIPRPIGRNKARRMKEKGKEREDKVDQEEEKKRRHEDMVQQRQEEMDGNMTRVNTTNMSPMRKEFSYSKKREIQDRHSIRELFPNSNSTSNYHPTMPGEDDDYF
ncbi:PREDICTED: uncharacterized protein [Prunus dulcis]|uniref:PREDICTED: uncharacterized protein n=1 Tax=Prunus dulcis TaxID=3755 RepID=A0A5E4GJX6_PRUDU|nr:PREDICTED: uncharacterized protein [Prunus dulcis]